MAADAEDRIEVTSYAQVAEGADTEFERIPATIAVLDKLIVRLGAAMQEQAVPDFDRFSETVSDLRQEFRTELASKFIEPERNLGLLTEQLGIVIENQHARFSDAEVRDAAGRLVKAGRLLKEYTEKRRVLYGEY